MPFIKLLGDHRALGLRLFGSNNLSLDGVREHLEKQVGEIKQDRSDMSRWVDGILICFYGAIKTGGEGSEILEYLFGKKNHVESRIIDNGAWRRVLDEFKPLREQIECWQSWAEMAKKMDMAALDDDHNNLAQVAMESWLSTSRAADLTDSPPLQS